ncbi:unnamed protein product, partial [Owenia fusiformis]
ETTPAETTPAETTLKETTPAETTLLETTPAETTLKETTPAETTLIETSTAETITTEVGGSAGGIPTEVDPCANTSIYDSEGHYSNRWDFKPPGNCDQYIPSGWWRFRHNEEDAIIPTSCIKQGYCGTGRPMVVDLGGVDMPEAGVTIEAHTCTIDVFVGVVRCCGVSKTPIRIKNCGDFYAYELKNTEDFTCPTAFCLQLENETLPWEALGNPPPTTTEAPTTQPPTTEATTTEPTTTQSMTTAAITTTTTEALTTTEASTTEFSRGTTVNKENATEEDISVVNCTSVGPMLVYCNIRGTWKRASLDCKGIGLYELSSELRCLSVEAYDAMRAQENDTFTSVSPISDLTQSFTSTAKDDFDLTTIDGKQHKITQTAKTPGVTVHTKSPPGTTSATTPEVDDVQNKYLGIPYRLREDMREEEVENTITVYFNNSQQDFDIKDFDENFRYHFMRLFNMFLEDPSQFPTEDFVDNRRRRKRQTDLETTIEAVATTVETTAENAQTTAAEAATTVEEVVTTVAAIEATVEAIQTTDEAVQTTVEAVQTTAEIVQTTAETVQTTVAEDDTTVAAGETTVEAVETTTEVAETTVETVQTTIEAAQTTAETVQTTVTEVGTTVAVGETTAEVVETVEPTETTVEATQTTVEKVQTVQTTVEEATTLNEAPVVTLIPNTYTNLTEEALIYVAPTPRETETGDIEVAFFILNSTDEEREDGGKYKRSSEESDVVDKDHINTALANGNFRKQLDDALKRNVISWKQGPPGGAIVIAEQRQNVFDAHYGLWITLFVLAGICVIVIIIALICILCKGKRGKWTPDDKEHMKLEQGHGDVENPISDEEIMRDEAGMMEKSPPVNGHHKPQDEDNGWVVPIEQFTEQERAQAEVEDTKL